MSRIGNKTITLPDKVKLNVSDRGEIQVEGPRGKLQWNLPRDISVDISEQSVKVLRKKETRPLRALHGLSRSLVANMVT
ncbi:MAG: 50S ribosomal protein L6, partial [Opitutaceae bacterium]|nr:50S ribosomal protein L6 [Verrucomicrobiales bacterium]